MSKIELQMRVVSFQEALNDLNRNPRSFIIINIERHPKGIPMPNRHLLDRLNEDCTGDLLIVPTVLAELDAHLPLCRDRVKFIAGELVVVEVTKVRETFERHVGGQDVVGLEERVRDGLYVTVTMATERLRACADFSEHRRMATEARRGEIFERLDPILLGLSARNCFDAGQRRIGNRYPGATARLTMKSAYTSVRVALQGGADPVVVDAGQVELVRTASAIYAKAGEFLNAQHAMSDMLRELTESIEFKKASVAEQENLQARLLRERAPALHQEMAHNKLGGPSWAQLLPAAAAMDFNPSSVFASVLFYKTELDCAMLLGRVERGVGAILAPKHIVRLRRIMAQADEAGNAVGDMETEAARFLRDLALLVKSRAGWAEFFDLAETDGGALWITKSL